MEFGVLAAEGWGEEVEADFGDVFDGGVEAAGFAWGGVAELFGVGVEVFVVEALDDEGVGEVFEVGEGEGRG